MKIKNQQKEAICKRLSQMGIAEPPKSLVNRLLILVEDEVTISTSDLVEKRIERITEKDILTALKTSAKNTVQEGQ